MKLVLSIGQYSDKGRKALNQDFHGALIPGEPLLTSKGIAIALADGISSSSVSGIAAQSAVKGFLTDYYCTSETWSVKTSAQRVIAATNSWLHAQTRRGPDPYDRDKGYVCTLTVMVVKAATAHFFHAGDSAVLRLSGASLEPLTDLHRVAVSSQQSYLSRALGMNAQIEIDYNATPVEAGDVFLMATDGVHEHVDGRFVAKTVETWGHDLDTAARLIAEEALRRGSTDNLTAQLVRVDEVPPADADIAIERAVDLPLPPLPEARQTFDGYRIIRELHASSRSHIYLAADSESEELVALKLPSIDLRGDAAYLKRFVMEEWVARRIASAHVLKPVEQRRKRNFLYVPMEFVEGQTLQQWMADHPRPDLEAVRGIIEQVGKGLRAFHRREMLHQDLRPANIMIDRTGTAKIIDFGSTHVAGVAESRREISHEILGTAQYTAPEVLLGEASSEGADIYSLGAICYHALSGRLPFGGRMAAARKRSQQMKLAYLPLSEERRDIPPWIDGAIRKALHPDPLKRYQDVDEFLFDLRQPRREFLAATKQPLVERNPLLFWKLLSLGLGFVVFVLLLKLTAIGR